MMWSSMCAGMSRMEWSYMGWRSVHWCMNWSVVLWGMYR